MCFIKEPADKSADNEEVQKVKPVYMYVVQMISARVHCHYHLRFMIGRWHDEWQFGDFGRLVSLIFVRIGKISHQ